MSNRRKQPQKTFLRPFLLLPFSIRPYAFPFLARQSQRGNLFNASLFQRPEGLAPVSRRPKLTDLQGAVASKGTYAEINQPNLAFYAPRLLDGKKEKSRSKEYLGKPGSSFEGRGLGTCKRTGFSKAQVCRSRTGGLEHWNGKPSPKVASSCRAASRESWRRADFRAQTA